MLAKLVEFSLTQRLLVAVLALMIIGAGWGAFHELPIDAFPDVSSTQVKVIMKVPGMTPEGVTIVDQMGALLSKPGSGDEIGFNA